MGLCQYVDLCFPASSYYLVCIPTSFYVFYFLVYFDWTLVCFQVLFYTSPDSVPGYNCPPFRYCMVSFLHCSYSNRGRSLIRILRYKRVKFDIFVIVRPASLAVRSLQCAIYCHPHEICNGRRAVVSVS